MHLELRKREEDRSVHLHCLVEDVKTVLRKRASIGNWVKFGTFLVLGF